jgi:hypothetical protein
MNLKGISDLFIKATKENFPVEECKYTYRDFERFKASKKTYTCLLKERRHKGELIIRNLKPIIEIDGEKIVYGWFDENDFLYDNLENSFEDYSLVVLGFVENSSLKEDGEFVNEIWKERCTPKRIVM